MGLRVKVWRTNLEVLVMALGVLVISYALGDYWWPHLDWLWRCMAIAMATNSCSSSPCFPRMLALAHLGLNVTGVIVAT